MTKQEVLNKIPKSFIINGKKYKVSLEDNLIDSADESTNRDLGQCRYYVEPYVKVATKWDGDDIHEMAILNTFYHELMHVFITEAHLVNLDPPSLELLVQSLANLYLQYEQSREQTDWVKE